MSGSCGHIGLVFSFTDAFCRFLCACAATDQRGVMVCLLVHNWMLLAAVLVVFCFVGLVLSVCFVLAVMMLLPAEFWCLVCGCNGTLVRLLLQSATDALRLSWCNPLIALSPVDLF